MMQSNGGLVRTERAAKFPILTLLSGPAGGAMAAGYLGQLLGERHLLTLDMGGTSCDVTGVIDNHPDTRIDFEIGGYAVSYPTIDIQTVGAGGGSIARVDEVGRLSVGPASAGSDPGPACYGRGGELPTVTDAILVLGVYEAEHCLGGEIYPDFELASRAIERHVAVPLGLSLIDAAAGIIRLVNANMMNAVRSVSVERGRDPRDFVLVAFGGAGPTHGVHIAVELAISRVVIPPMPGCNSALGILASDVRHDLVATIRARMTDIEPVYLAEVLENLSDQAHTELDQDRIASEDRTVSISLDMRYAGQAYELNVPLASLEPDGTILRKAVADFHLLHKTRYGHQLDDDLVEVVVVRLTALGAIPKPMLKSSTQSGGTPQPRSRREIHAMSGGSSIIPVYHRDDLEPGHRLITPAIVQQLDSTAYLPFGKAVVDVTGSIVVDLP